MSTRWYYAKSGTTDRQGPVTLEQIQAKIASGELTAQDIAWRSGMPQWAPVGQLPELATAPRPVPPRLPPSPLPAASYTPPATSHTPPVATYAEPAQSHSAPTAAPVAAASVGYFTPGREMPERARENLEGFAPATGPTGDWPLNDDHILQLAGAVKWRKRILAAAGLTKFFFIIYLLGSVVLGMITVFASITAKNFTRDALPTLIALAIVIPFAALFGFAASAIKYCRMWGSLVMGTLVTLGLLLQVGIYVFMQVSPTPGTRTDGAELFGLVFYLFIGLVFAVIYWRAFSANSRYLNTPVWCQEALAVAEQSK